jgi:autotransporter-associated beta strand protein
MILHNGFAAAGGAGFVFENNGAAVEGVVYSSGDSTLSGSVHGSGGLTTFGPGSLSLISNNDFTGGLTINQGTVRVRHVGALNAANPNAVVINGTGTLDLYQTSVTVAGLSGDGTVTNTQGGTLSIYTLTVDATADQTFAGALRNQFGRGQLGLTKTGPAALTLTGTYGYVGPTTVSAGTLNANFAVSEAWAQRRDFSIATGATLNVGGQLFAGNIDGDGTMTVNTGGVVTARRVRQDELAVTGAGSLTMMEGIPTRPADVSRVRELSVSPTARLNLNNNALIVDYDAGADSPLAEVAGAVALGHGAGGTWDGPGISSGSAATSGGLTSLAVAEAADVLGLSGEQTGTFWHQIVDASAVLIHYTYGGDATMDGKINIDDYGQIDFNIASPTPALGWFNGDFNYDGKIDIDDYGIVDFNVTQQTGTFPGASGVLAATPRVARLAEDLTAVPEPNVAILGLAGGAAALRRRRDRISPSREG